MSEVLEPLRLGDRLVASGYITPGQLSVLLVQQKQLRESGRRVRLGELAVRSKFCLPGDIASALDVHGGAAANPTEGDPLLSPADCVRLQVAVQDVDGKTLVVRAARALTPADRRAVLQACTANVETVRTVLVDRRELHRYMSRLTGHESFAEVIGRLRSPEFGHATLKDAIDALLHEAIDRRASDVHLSRKPEPDSWVSLRIDASLRPLALLPERLMAMLFSRMKTMAGMDAANSRSAMDGRIPPIEHRGRTVSFRVATQPLVDGEKMVIRIQDDKLESVAKVFPNQPEMVRMVRDIAATVGVRGGLVLVTGATGSGKTRTANTIAARFPRDRINLMTVEDPVETHLPFASQIQIAQLLDQKATDIERSLLRQDPDVVLFGEIRDVNSATAAMRITETGHLVLATLHAGSAVQAVERLMSLVPEAARASTGFVLASTLTCVVNQSLVARLCECATPAGEGDGAGMGEGGEARDLLTKAGLYLGEALPRGLRLARGCARCEYTGYHGRVAIHETLMFRLDDDERADAARRVSTSGNIAPLMTAAGLRVVTRQHVAMSLLEGGLIDALTARLACDEKTRDGARVRVRT